MFRHRAVRELRCPVGRASTDKVQPYERLKRWKITSASSLPVCSFGFPLCRVLSSDPQLGGELPRGKIFYGTTIRLGKLGQGVEMQDQISVSFFDLSMGVAAEIALRHPEDYRISQIHSSLPFRTFRMAVSKLLGQFGHLVQT
jgi:hypothetical protein